MRFPEKPRDYDSLLKEIYTLRKMDLEYSKILGTMNSKPEDDLIGIYSDFLETNLGDPKKFLGTKEIENRLIQMVLDLFNAPKSAGGRVVSGGTEGNIMAVVLAKNLSRGNELIIPDYAHFSFQKISKIMNIKLKVVDASKDYVMDPKILSKSITKNTFAVVTIAGTTELGLIDPIPEISDICYDNSVFLHVDAAFGGFIIPFLKDVGYDIPDFDFSLKGVSTISADGHKMGGCAVPLGFFLSREEEWFNRIGVKTPYVSTDYQSTILGTRSGGSVAYGYAKFNLLGKEGFRDVARRCMELRKYTEKKLKEKGFSLFIEPVLNVLAVRVESLDYVVKRLYEKGWGVNPIKRLSSFRLVMMPYLKKEMIDNFVDDLENICFEVKK